MRLYLVFREGVYRHGLVSITRSEADAHHNAKAALAAEHDDYHRFGIYRGDTVRALSFTPKERYAPNEDGLHLIGSYFKNRQQRVEYREASR